MKAYKISTGDDPDQNASEDTHYKKAANPTMTPRQALIAKLHELGIDVNAYAKEKGLSAKTSEETFLKLLAELGGKR